MSRLIVGSLFDLRLDITGCVYGVGGSPADEFNTRFQECSKGKRPLTGEKS